MGYISEDYCSEELSGMLMEKGYIGATNTYLGKDDINVKQITLQSAMKWLREKHNLHIITLPYAPIDKNPYHPGEADVVYIAQLFKGIIPIDKIGRSVIKLTHEQACEAAIRYTLENLIN